MVYNTKNNNNNFVGGKSSAKNNNKEVGTNGLNNLNSVKRVLNRNFITGYADGESSFSVRLRKSADSR